MSTFERVKEWFVFGDKSMNKIMSRIKNFQIRGRDGYEKKKPELQMFNTEKMYKEPL